MLSDRIEAKWIDAFCEIFERCAVKPGDTAAILSETQSRALNVHLAELALLRIGARPFHIVVPTPRNRQIVPVRSTGASEAIARLAPVVTALQQAGFTVAGTRSSGLGFVCRINGLPTVAQQACIATPPVTAYWSYYHSLAGATTWSYSTLGPLSYKPPQGSIEAWAFGASAKPSKTPAQVRLS